MQPSTPSCVDFQVSPFAFGLLRGALPHGLQFGAMTAQGPGWRVLTWPSAPTDAPEAIMRWGMALAAKQFDGPFVAGTHLNAVGAAWPEAMTRAGSIDGLHTRIAVVPGATAHAVVIAQDPQWRRNDASVASALCADVLTQGPEAGRWRCGPVSLGRSLMAGGCTGALQVPLGDLHVDADLEQSLEPLPRDAPWPESTENLTARLDAALNDLNGLGLPEAMPCVARRSAASPRRICDERAVLITAPGTPPTWWIRSTALWRIDAEHAVAQLATVRCPQSVGPAVFELVHAMCAAWQLP